MKQIFTLIAVLASTTLFAQSFSENFETADLAQLQTKGWAFSGATRNATTPLTGTYDVILIPTTGSTRAQIQTPFLNLTTAGSLSFNYRLSGNATRTATLYLIDKAGTTTTVSAVALTSTTKSAATYTLPASSGIKKVLIEISGSGGGNVNEFIDDISFTTATQYYTTGVNRNPTAGNDSYAAATLGSYTGTSVLANDNDLDGETLQPSVVSTNNGTVVLNNDGTFTFTPAAAFTGGTASFTYSVTDNGYPAATATATATINYPVAASTLPIRLLSFTGAVSGNQALLTWNVDDNETGSFFQVQKSTDGKRFTDMATIAITAKTGTETYQYNEALNTENAYYRLQVTNKDKSVSYSRVVFLKGATAATAGLTVLQNPIKGNTIQFAFTSTAQESVTINLYSLNGGLLCSRNVSVQKGSNTVSLNINSGLSTGTYVLETVSATAHNLTKLTK